jgi:hypothetical protein
VDAGWSVVITNEFASVEIRVVEHGNGRQAILTDRRSGASRLVDVLALEGLVRVPESLIDTLTDPALAELPEDTGCQVIWDVP